ncbi:aldehyde dehydrogenase [Gemmobacter nanjingensis]|uniref:aldehyde dehydrogenase (NAD(+)) n=1 Tax=Gemmobacter nanjingensis TaxID=488454 RepID=A0ABQ3FHT6_9RHOB|nr:aldehyde dehydrogenase family protein [Gemmobacter nanjingensis]GHC24932.1 aldehyde dehydrogenase [Gemmobacter nanjingensis]
MTPHLERFYINGRWVDPVAGRDAPRLPVIDPATEEPFCAIVLGGAQDVDRAVGAAREAFPGYAALPRQRRIALLQAILAVYDRRSDDLARAISREMGAPLPFAREAQVGIGRAHLTQMITTLESYAFSQMRGGTCVLREPIGVIGMITPWNWPMNQIVCKVAPALAAGCTMVLKPSEVAPLSGLIFAEILDEAGVPAGVFNLVSGDGAGAGAALSRHPDVDMMSFTGSTRAGILVAEAAAATVKRVSQELGGKSANILLPDADFPTAVAKGVAGCFGNSGQSCNAPTRMLVPADRHDEVLELAARATATFRTGPPEAPETQLGPVVSAAQFGKIQQLIATGIAEGATLVAGGPGRPEGLNKGFYVRPTVFGHVTPDMTVAREEIFGPVLSVISYQTEDEAIALANATEYGLAAYVQSADPDRARRVATQMRAGTVYLNYPAWDSAAPFGGYKRSGNGREYADFALDDVTEIKGVVGWG